MRPKARPAPLFDTSVVRESCGSPISGSPPPASESAPAARGRALGVGAEDAGGRLPTVGKMSWQSGSPFVQRNFVTQSGELVH